MTGRERLIELIKEGSTKAGEHFREVTKKVLAEKGSFNSRTDRDRYNIYEIEADYLLANGVIVPPCKAGTKVFLLRSLMNDVIEGEVTAIKKTEFSEGYTVVFLIDDSRYTDVPFGAYGKTVFFTKEAAEQVLRKEDVK